MKTVYKYTLDTATEQQLFLPVVVWELQEVNGITPVIRPGK